METLEELQDRIETHIDQTYLMQTLKELVAINSIIGNEEEIARHIGHKLEDMGLDVEFDRVSPGSLNVYAMKEFSTDGKILHFNGHTDTVDIATGWNTDPFDPVTRDGKMFGLGVSDMKAGIACELTALQALLAFEDELTGTIQFSAVVDEEGHGSGAKRMMQHPIYGKPDAILIAEPFFGDSAEDGIPLGMTGKVLYQIDVNGKSAHAFRPHEGINAVTDASSIVVAVDEIFTQDDDMIGDFRVPRDDDFGDGSFCVLKIDGGYKIYNVSVPDHCQIILNRLTVPGESKEAVIDDMEVFISQLGLQSEVEISLQPPYYSAYTIDPKSKLFQALETSYQAAFGRKPVTTYDRMISDANIFCGEYGIPTLNFGPKGYNFHGANESIEIDTLLPSVKTMIGIYLRYQQNNNPS